MATSYKLESYVNGSLFEILGDGFATENEARVFANNLPPPRDNEILIIKMVVETIVDIII